MDVIDALLWRSILFLPLAISGQMALSFAFKAESLFHQKGPLFHRLCINVHCIGIFLVRGGCSPVVNIRPPISYFPKHGHRESVVCVILDSSVGPFSDCGGHTIGKSNLLHNHWVQVRLGTGIPMGFGIPFVSSE